MSDKSNIGLFLVLCWFVCLNLTSCDDEPEQLPPRDAEGRISLRDVKTASLLKRTIEGTWKIHYSRGGFTGREKNKLQNSYFRYLPNDSMYLVFGGRPYAATIPKLVRERTIYGYEAWLLNFEFYNAWGLRDKLIIERLKGDTLVLNSNALDSYAYDMKKE